MDYGIASRLARAFINSVGWEGDDYDYNEGSTIFYQLEHETDDMRFTFRINNGPVLGFISDADIEAFIVSKLLPER